MGDKKQVTRLKKGVPAWNQWRSESSNPLIDLTGANLTDANLRSANLIGADLTRPRPLPAHARAVENICAGKQFDADLGGNIAKEIRESFIPDFSNWKNDDAYTHSFERLVAALKTSD